MELHYRAGDALHTVQVARERPLRYRVTVDGRPYEVDVVSARSGALDLRLGGVPLRGLAAEDGPRRFVKIEGRPLVRLERVESRGPGGRARPGAGPPGAALRANMHGQVAAVLVAEGARVERGQTLIVLEAMKMELRVTAPHAGRVKQVLCQVGEVVERGKVLVEVEPDPPRAPEGGDVP